MHLQLHLAFYLLPLPGINLEICFKTARPTFRSKPALVVGIPVDFAIDCFAAVMPNNLFNEKENPNFPINGIFWNVRFCNNHPKKKTQ